MLACCDVKSASSPFRMCEGRDDLRARLTNAYVIVRRKWFLVNANALPSPLSWLFHIALICFSSLLLDSKVTWIYSFIWLDSYPEVPLRFVSHDYGWSLQHGWTLQHRWSPQHRLSPQWQSSFFDFDYEPPEFTLRQV